MALTNSVTDVIRITRGLIQDKIKTDGRDAEICNDQTVFTITQPFIDSSTISVFKNGTQLSSGAFTYNSDNNQVTIPTAVKNDVIIITYSYYEKYSDSEIQEFLESSLSYFPQYQYKKTFIIDDNDKIVAINGLNPTKEELYFIAGIASIVIDPQNVKISIPDLSITARRDESDLDQIKRAFRNFKNFVGAISFDIVEDLRN